MYALIKNNSRFIYLNDLSTGETIRFKEHEAPRSSEILFGEVYHTYKDTYNSSIPDIAVNSGFDGVLLLRYDDTFFIYYKKAEVGRDGYYVDVDMLKEIELTKTEFINLNKLVSVKVVELSEEKYNSYNLDITTLAKLKLLTGANVESNTYSDLCSTLDMRKGICKVGDEFSIGYNYIYS